MHRVVTCIHSRNINIIFIQWPWTSTYDLDFTTWPGRSSSWTNHRAKYLGQGSLTPKVNPATQTRQTHAVSGLLKCKVVTWHSGRTSVCDRWTFPVLCSICGWWV